MESAGPAPVADEIVDGRYRLVAVAGVGGFGKVHRAIDLTTGDAVAVKILAVSASVDGPRFRREAAILSTLRHPRVVRYLGHGTTAEGSPYLAMQWLEGIDLGRRLERGPLALDEGLRAVLRAAEGVGAVHDAGVVHRDVKPTNLFLVGEHSEDVRLIDFGIARFDAVGGTLTATGALLGTPPYMSPEQAIGDREVTPAADVFSLGCVLFEALTGQRAFDGTSQREVLGKILRGTPPDFVAHEAKLPRLVAALLSRMLAYEAADRLPDANAVAVALAALVADVSATPPGLSHRFLASTSRVRASSTVAIVVDPASPEGRQAQLQAMQGGAVIVTVQGEVQATFRREALLEAARRGAHLALTWRRAAPTSAIHMTSSRGEPAASIEESPPRPDPALGIALDRTSAEILEHAFEIRDERGARYLVGARRLGISGGPFLGRAKELASVTGAIEAALEDPGASIILVRGEAGTGKSRLLEEALRLLRERRHAPIVLAAHADEPSAARPFALLAQLVADLLADEETIDPRKRCGALVQRGLELTDAEWACDLADKWSEGGPGFRRSREASAQVVVDGYRSAWLALVEMTARRQGLVLAVEDVHLADTASLKLLDAALEQAAQLPFAIVATARAGDGDDPEALFAARAPDIVRLGALRRNAAAALVRHLAPNEPDDGVEAIVARAEGNPLHLEELSLLDESRGEAPGTLRAIVEARLSRLPRSVQRWLACASVLGRSAEIDAVTEITGEPLVASLGAVEAAHRARFLDERSTPGTVQFRHSLLREAAYASLGEAERGAAHGRAAAWLQQRAGADPCAVAWHLERGNEVETAAPWYLVAARNALDGENLGRAIDLAERAHACAAGAELRADAQLLLAEARFQEGRMTDAHEAARRAMESSTPGDLSWSRAASVLVTALGQSGDNAELRAVALRVVAQAPVAAARSAWIVCLCRAVTQLSTAGERDLLPRLLEAIGAGEVRDPSARAWVARAAAAAAIQRNDYEDALASIAQAAELHAAAGEMRQCALMRIHRASTGVFAGDFASAAADLDVADAIAKRTGATYFARWASYARGKILAYTADPHVAGAALRAVRGAMTGSPRIVAGTLIYEAIAAFRAGDPVWAERSARAALAAHDVRETQALAYAALARALFDQDRRGEGREAAARAAALLAEAGSLSELESLVHLAVAEAAVRGDDQAAARAVVASVGERIARIAAKLHDPVVRDAFLHRIEPHDRILRLCHEVRVSIGVA